MSVVGIDFGTQFSVVNLVHNGQFNVVLNESSKRKTPTIVGYDDLQRKIGEKGSESQKSNAKRTISEIKRLIGRQYSHPDVQNDLKLVHFETVPTADDHIRIVVRTNEGEFKLSPEQIAGAFLAHLRRLSELKVGAGRISDVVISCPPYFTQVERMALIDAAKVAGLSVLRLMNETTAVALKYAINLRTSKAPVYGKVLIVDVGHAATNVALVDFKDGELQVLATASERALGGRDYDMALTQHFAEEIRGKYKIDPLSKPKPFMRLRDALKKTKHVLSANKEASLSVECLMDDVDVSGHITRDEFNASTKHLTERVLVPVKKVLADTQTEPKDILALEIVGGGTRVPAVKDALSELINTDASRNKLSMTLNADEDVAWGCAYQCAMLSPSFRARSIQVKDVSPYAIEVCSGPVTDDYKSPACQFEDQLELFSRFNLIPSTKMIEYRKTEPFQLVLRYANPSDSSSSSGFIARYVITPPPVPADALSPPRFKVRLEMDINGVVGLKSVTLYEEKPPEPEPEPAAAPEAAAATEEAKKDAPAPMEDDGAAKAADAETPAAAPEKGEEAATVDTAKGDAMEDDTPAATPSADGDAMDTSKEEAEKDVKDKEEKPKKKKKKYKKTEFPWESQVSTIMTDDEFKGAFEQEVQMANQDRIVQETSECKNALETYVYETRSDLEMGLRDFVTEEVRKEFTSQLDEAENWLYTDEGEYAKKSVYVKRLTDLRKVGDPIFLRRWEDEHRQAGVDRLKSVVVQYQSFLMDVQEQEEKYSHITEEERTKLRDESTAVDLWLAESLQKQDKCAKHEDPAFKVADCEAKVNALNKVCYPIMTKVKPKPKEEPKPAPAADEAKPDAAAADEKPAASEKMSDDPPAAGAADGGEKDAAAPAADATAAQENGTTASSQEVPMQD